MNSKDYRWLYPLRWYAASLAFLLGLGIFIPMAVVLYYIGDSLKTDDLITKHKHEELQTFLTHNPDRVNKPNHSGRAPIHSAIYKNDIRACKIILECGGDANLRVDLSSDDPQWTPLHCAAAVGSIEIGKLLVQHGADTNSVSFLGNTPIDVAKEDYTRTESEEYLQFIAWAERGYPVD